MRIRTPHPHDVLCGRGGGINSHPGNKTFRQWVSKRKEAYNLASSKVEKARVSREIMDKVRALVPPGRFLMREENANFGQPLTPSMMAGVTGFWVEIDETKAMAKTSQALREGAPKIRAQHSVEIGEPVPVTPVRRKRKTPVLQQENLIDLPTFKAPSKALHITTPTNIIVPGQLSQISSDHHGMSRGQIMGQHGVHATPSVVMSPSSTQMALKTAAAMAAQAHSQGSSNVGSSSLNLMGPPQSQPPRNQTQTEGGLPSPRSSITQRLFTGANDQQESPSATYINGWPLQGPTQPNSSQLALISPAGFRSGSGMSGSGMSGILPAVNSSHTPFIPSNLQYSSAPDLAQDRANFAIGEVSRSYRKPSASSSRRHPLTREHSLAMSDVSERMADVDMDDIFQDPFAEENAQEHEQQSGAGSSTSRHRHSSNSMGSFDLNSSDFSASNLSWLSNTSGGRGAEGGGASGERRSFDSHGSYNTNGVGPLNRSIGNRSSNSMGSLNSAELRALYGNMQNAASVGRMSNSSQRG